MHSTAPTHGICLVGHLLSAFSTGSGDEVGALMVALAKQIAGGMVGLATEKESN